jgi:ferritin
MISEKVQKALNDQIQAEIFSSYLYLSMAAYFHSESWNGFAAWMKIQSEEEYGHAMKLMKYVNDVEGKVTLEAIEKPKSEWKSPFEAFEEAHKHELYITEHINLLYQLTIQEKDYPAQLMLNYFINEQVEEVSTIVQIVNKFKAVGDNRTSVYFLDRELGMRARS